MAEELCVGRFVCIAKKKIPGKSTSPWQVILLLTRILRPFRTTESTSVGLLLISYGVLHSSLVLAAHSHLG